MSADIFEDFESRGVIHRSTLLLPPAVAIDFVRECRKRGIELLGFEGFTLASNDMIQPNLQHLLDLSAIPYKDLSVADKFALAEDFLGERLNLDIVFEMAIS